MGGFLMALLFGLIIVIPFWKIFDRVGLPSWLAVLMIVPVLNLVLMYYLAFTEWPAVPGNK